jgi:hypothetical protein
MAGMVGVAHFRAIARLTLSSNIWSVCILLTINALAVARDFIWSPKRPDPRDLLFKGYRCFSPGVQQSGLAVNQWAPLCAKHEWSRAFIPPVFLHGVVTTLPFIVSVSSVVFVFQITVCALCSSQHLRCGNRTPSDSWADVSTSVHLSVLECLTTLAAQVKLNGRE